MEKFTSLRSTVAPLPLNDVDTDMIIPAQYLTSVSREGFGEGLFRRLRDEQEEFVMNKPEFAQSQILVAGLNFGCGSSREHAVWAVMSGGFRAVIAKSFADIFYSNSAKNGLMLVTLAPEVVDSILADAQAGGYEINIDLEQQEVTLPDGVRHSFDYDPFRKHCMLHGLDDIDYIMAARGEINEFRKAQDKYRFSSTLENA